MTVKKIAFWAKKFKIQIDDLIHLDEIQLVEDFELVLILNGLGILFAGRAHQSSVS